MSIICKSDLPSESLLQKYQLDGSYTDCYHMDLPQSISMAQYVSAFYTTPLFKVEGKILSHFAGKHSTDSAAIELAYGRADHFSAWRVEGRADNQLLLCDFLGRTRSWLMVQSDDPLPAGSTRLYFGSAVMPKTRTKSGKASFGFVFHALSGFHHLYTKGLMHAARARLLRPAQ